MEEKILFSKEQIDNNVVEMGDVLTRYYAGKPLTAVAIMNGAMFFAADLLRHVENAGMWVDSMSVIGYQNDTINANMSVRFSLKLPVMGRHILLIDDIYDSGRTITAMKSILLAQGALSVKACVLLKKKLSAGKTQDNSCDWYCMEVCDEYVYGMGMDTVELKRNLPYVAYMAK